MFPGVVQYGDGSDATATATATAAPSEAAAPAESDRVTRTRDPARADDDVRLPAPLQYRDPARYEIVAEHGRGGLGRVFRARDKELGRDVALKELLSRGSTSELRFFREALITARLEHPGIVPVHEAGRWPDGTPFYAMKLVAGRPLKALIDECKTLEDRLALLPHVIAVADAIAYAHDRKIIHRDLKPSNIIVGDFGETVVIDWGLAKDISDQAVVDDVVEDGPFRTAAPGAGDGITVAGSIVGTPAYMSPEQARGETVDERADVYAIGAVLCDLTTTPGARTRGTPRVDPDLAAIIARAMSPRANERYPNAGALGRDLRSHLGALRVSARQYGLVGLLRLWYRRNPALAASVVIAMVLLSGLGLWSGSTILAEKNRAEDARSNESVARLAADEQRDTALMAQGRLLLERDPTAAHALIAPHNRSPDAALILARASGERTATYSRDLRSPITGASIAADGRSVAFATQDRTLRIVELSTHRETEIASDLPEFTPLEPDESGWRYVGLDESKPELRETRSGRRARLNAEARTIRSNRRSTLVLLANGTLLGVRDQSEPQELAHDVVAAALTSDDRVYACTKSDRLLIGQLASGRLTTASECVSAVADATLSASGTFALVAVTRQQFAVYRDGTPRAYDLPKETAIVRAALSPAGVVGLVDEHGGTYYVSTDGELSRGFRYDSRATRVACDDHGRIGWAYANGTVLVLDTTVSDSWSIKAHTAPLETLAFGPNGDALLTTSRNSLRVWSLSKREPSPFTSLPCVPFNLVPSPVASGLVGTDCAGGEVWVVDVKSGSSRKLHAHRELSFAVAWLGIELCSGGWDGRILCTDTHSHVTRLVAEHPVPSRWLATRDNELVYITADGGVWHHDSSETSAQRGSKRIASLPEEPYRITWRGESIAVSTRTGGLMFLENDWTTSTSRRPHEDVTNVMPAGVDTTFSFGLDGSIQAWRKTEPTLRWKLPGALRHLKALSTSEFVATLDRHRLHVQTHAAVLSLDVHAPLTATTVAGDYVVVSSQAGEVLSLDRRINGIAVVPLHDGEIRSLTALANGNVVAATSNGSLYHLDPQTFDYTIINKETRHAENQTTSQSFDCSHSYQRVTGQCSRR